MFVRVIPWPEIFKINSVTVEHGIGVARLVSMEESILLKWKLAVAR